MSIKDFLIKKNNENFIFRLYIAGQSANSLKAIQNLNRFSELYLKNFSIEIVDLLKEPGRALDDNIIAVPALVKLSPGPVSHLIGNLSNFAVIKKNLNLE